jgi:hypothetical protein
VRSSLLLSLLPLLAATTAHADEPPAAPPPVATPAATTPAPDPFDFDLLGDGKPAATAKPASLARLDRQVKLRRRMLLVHQVLGWVTAAALGGTTVFGQLNFNDQFGGPPGSGKGTFTGVHLGFGVATTALFALTGALAIFAPNPYPKPIHFDTGLVHKISMLVAAIGMTAQLVLGPITGAFRGQPAQKDLAIAHTVVGYTTYAFLTVGWVAYFF